MDKKVTKLVNATPAEISEDRILLGNNYAHLNGDGEFSATKCVPLSSLASANEITESRLLLEDPYAHLDEDAVGGFSAISSRAELLSTEKKERYTIDEIEKHAINLQKLMWGNRHKIWPNITTHRPVDVLDPIAALKFMGYDCEVEKNLGEFSSEGKLVEVAGTIDNSNKKVRISRHYSPNIQRFTAAHELGHAILHKTMGLHRDKPIDGSTATRRNSTEFEADKFSAFYTMPSKLVRNTFKQIFLTENFSINEATAVALGYDDYGSLMRKCKSLRDLSRVLASTERYNGRHFTSLANQFKVSVVAMAIRLEELGLVII